MLNYYLYYLDSILYLFFWGGEDNKNKNTLVLVDDA